MNLEVMNDSKTMTLKEITDLLEIEHKKAMKTVERMVESREFGEVELIATSYFNNMGAEIKLNTYRLSKRQSIAVAGRLNVDLQMRVIDRWLELEEKAIKPLTLEEMTIQVIQGQQTKILELEHQIKVDAPLTDFGRAISQSAGTCKVGDWIKAINNSGDIKIGRNKAFQRLRGGSWKNPYKLKNQPKKKKSRFDETINGISKSEIEKQARVGESEQQAANRINANKKA